MGRALALPLLSFSECKILLQKFSRNFFRLKRTAQDLNQGTEYSEDFPETCVPKTEKWNVGEGTVLVNEEADHARQEV